MPQRNIVHTNPDAVMVVLIVFFFELKRFKALWIMAFDVVALRIIRVWVPTALIVTSGALEAQRTVLETR